jgi:hypothetical protein
METACSVNETTWRGSINIGRLGNKQATDTRYGAAKLSQRGVMGNAGMVLQIFHPCLS